MQEDVPDPGSYFTLNSVTGAIEVKRKIDREKVNKFLMTVVASDNPIQGKILTGGSGFLPRPDMMNTVSLPKTDDVSRVADACGMGDKFAGSFSPLLLELASCVWFLVCASLSSVSVCLSVSSFVRVCLVVCMCVLNCPGPCAYLSLLPSSVTPVSHYYT